MPFKHIPGRVALPRPPRRQPLVAGITRRELAHYGKMLVTFGMDSLQRGRQLRAIHPRALTPAKIERAAYHPGPARQRVGRRSAARPGQEQERYGRRLPLRDEVGN